MIFRLIIYIVIYTVPLIFFGFAGKRLLRAPLARRRREMQGRENARLLLSGDVSPEFAFFVVNPIV